MMRDKDVIKIIIEKSEKYINVMTISNEKNPVRWEQYINTNDLSYNRHITHYNNDVSAASVKLELKTARPGREIWVPAYAEIFPTKLSGLVRCTCRKLI